MDLPVEAAGGAPAYKRTRAIGAAKPLGPAGLFFDSKSSNDCARTMCSGVTAEESPACGALHAASSVVAHGGVFKPSRGGVEGPQSSVIRRQSSAHKGEERTQIGGRKQRRFASPDTPRWAMALRYSPRQILQTGVRLPMAVMIMLPAVFTCTIMSAQCMFMPLAQPQLFLEQATIA